MKYYIISSAQALGEGDPSLTELGRLQAARLSAYIQYLGYSGKIYSAPGAGATETAQIIAERTGASVIAWDPELDILGLQEDSMFVGDRERADALIRLLNIPKYKHNTPDCSFSVVDSQGAMESRCKDVAHLPSAMVSEGTQMQIEKKRQRVKACMEQGIAVPEEITGLDSLKLLHIGDTHSEAYPFYRELIQKVQPDIIIHTGDFVDEVKVGRMINTEEEYKEGLKRIARILEESGAEHVYVVPGNNDIPDLLRQYMPFAQYVEPNSQILICGTTCTLGHECYNTTVESQWSFYGHGLTGETWKPEMNRDLNGTCRFNVTWGPKVFLLPEKRVFEFKEP